MTAYFPRDVAELGQRLDVAEARLDAMDRALKGIFTALESMAELGESLSAEVRDGFTSLRTPLVAKSGHAGAADELRRLVGEVSEETKRLADIFADVLGPESRGDDEDEPDR